MILYLIKSLMPSVGVVRGLQRELKSGLTLTHQMIVVLRSSFPAAFHQLGEPATPVNVSLARCSASMTCSTALIKARCVSAWGKLPRWRAVFGVELFTKESERARGADQLLTVGSRPVELADLHQRRYEPEGTDREAALVLTTDPVVGRGRSVAIDERTITQLVGDSKDGFANPFVVGRKKSPAAEATRVRRLVRSTR